MSGYSSSTDSVAHSRGGTPPPAVSERPDSRRCASACQTISKIIIVAATIIGVIAYFAALPLAEAIILSVVTVIAGAFLFNLMSGNPCCSCHESYSSSSYSRVYPHTHITVIDRGGPPCVPIHLPSSPPSTATATIVQRAPSSFFGGDGGSFFGGSSGAPIPSGMSVRPGGGFAASSTSSPFSFGRGGFSGIGGLFSGGSSGAPIPSGMSVRPGGGFAASSGPPIPRGTHIVPGTG